MGIRGRWVKEEGWRLVGSRLLDRAKLQAPGIIRVPGGGFRLFYTAVGPAKPFPTCQGYILSAFSEDGISFEPEPGIRVAPQPGLAHMALRVIAPAVTPCEGGRWRMYFEARGAATEPMVICSAISDDMLDWQHEPGIRLQGPGSVRAPRYLSLADGRGRLYCCGIEYGTGGPAGGEVLSEGILSAHSEDGLHFELELGYRLQPLAIECESGGFSAAEVVPPTGTDDDWAMVYSAWQDVSPGAVVPVHPSRDSALSEDFAAASIASDMAGFRSRIYTAFSRDGTVWERGNCVVEGAGYGEEGVDAVHAEDMSLLALGGGMYRMYYAACDKDGHWGVASAVMEAE
jgi:hypothetical protein